MLLLTHEGSDKRLEGRQGARRTWQVTDVDDLLTSSLQATCKLVPTVAQSVYNRLHLAHLCMVVQRESRRCIAALNLLWNEICVGEIFILHAIFIPVG